jgi:hypothetical protein
MWFAMATGLHDGRRWKVWPQGQGSLRPGLAIVVSSFDARTTHSLYSTLLADATFHGLLLAYDCDLADAARCAGCARCSGVSCRRFLAQAAWPAPDCLLILAEVVKAVPTAEWRSV